MRQATGSKLSTGPRAAVLTLSAVLALAAGAGAARSARVVAGIDRARLLPPAGAEIDGYDNAGYHLRRIGDEIEIEVEASPLASRTRFTLPAPSGSDPVTRLARGLATGAVTHYDATSRILGWVARHVDYDLDRSQPQDAGAVLSRRSGYCTGVARLTVALLAAVDIPAREVAGYVLGSEPGGPRGYHRWIESYLPDRGWVFSDPLRSHHYVPATYLRLASEALVPERGIEGLLLERRDALATVDLYPLAAPGITARRNSDRQLAAALAVRVEEQTSGMAVLTGESWRRTHTLVEGATTFVGLDPGRYTLRLLLPGGVIERSVELPDRIYRVLSLAPPEPQARAIPPPAAPGRQDLETQGSKP